MTTLQADPMKMSEDERQCLSESRGGSANVISIFSYCARRYFRLGHYIVLRSFLRRFAKPERFLDGSNLSIALGCCSHANVERVNAQKSLILKERETYYTKGTLNTWLGTF